MRTRCVNRLAYRILPPKAFLSTAVISKKQMFTVTVLSWKNDIPQKMTLKCEIYGIYVFIFTYICLFKPKKFADRHDHTRYALQPFPNGRNYTKMAMSEWI